MLKFAMTLRTHAQISHKHVIHITCPLRGTFHQSLRARDHKNLKSCIGGKCRDRPSSLETRA